jgi:membrane fusion protein (multidrug efflux system)
VSVQTLSSPSEKTTTLAPGASNWWRRGAWAVAALVVASAVLARQQIAVQTESAVAAGTYPGILRPLDVTTVALPVPITVTQVNVMVGDLVTAGQVLLTLDDVEARRALDNLRFEAASSREQAAQLARTVAALDRSINALSTSFAELTAELVVAQRDAEVIPVRQWKDSPERAQTAFDQAVARERRFRDLSMNGVVSRQDLEDAQFAVRVTADDLTNAHRSAEAGRKLAGLQALQARAQADLALAEQRRQRGDRLGDLAQARIRQAQAEASLTQAEARLADTTVRAVADAIVAEVSVRPADRVLAGMPLVKLATVNTMVVDVDVPPTVVNALHRGDPVDIRLPDARTPVHGRVRTIAPLPGAGGAHALEVAFANPSGTLLAGQTASVSFSAKH